MVRRLFICSFYIFLSLISYGAQNNLVRRVSPSEIQQFTDKVGEYICSRAKSKVPLTVKTIYWYKNGTVEIYFSAVLAEQPLRDSDIKWLYSTASSMLSEKFPKCVFKIFANKLPVEKLSSKWFSGKHYYDGIWNSPDGLKMIEKFRKEFEAKSSGNSVWAFAETSNSEFDTVKVSYAGHSSGMNGSSTRGGNRHQWVCPVNEPGLKISKGLEGKNIALWSSHGYFYNNPKGIWTWQRPCLFQTCEDLLSSDIVINYLVPMLENAGAYVIMPKERDINTDEVIVDNGSDGYAESGKWTDSQIAGFGGKVATLLEGDNPFRRGTCRETRLSDGYASASWVPELPKAGNYSVYVSYLSLPNSTTAVYTVHHSGEKTVFHVNQRMGGGTWVYLGTFFFDQKENSENDIRNGVTLETHAKGTTSVVTADAVRFGGGYGTVSRNGMVSGMPRFMEGARYWFQYAGYPENMYSPLCRENDYKDDYSSRAIWVNTLSGGSEVNPYMSGYGVPVDLSFALHTDSGISFNDSIVGTLAIHTTISNEREYLADGRSRYINRELCDIIQTQVVEDLRNIVDSSWNRRGIWDKSYLECREPEVPSMILELLSHQNLADIRYASDPLFKFTVARAIYKGMLTFFKATKGKDFEIQPLPVRGFFAGNREGHAFLRWNPSEDAKGYLIYRRIVDVLDASDGMLRNPDRYYGFVLEGYSEKPEYISPELLKNGYLYSYKVVAVNAGGVSFPSEILSVCSGNHGQALAINCFDRLSAPKYYGLMDSLEGGFRFWEDRGVSWSRDISYVGDQYSYSKNDAFVDNDNPGFGASWTNLEQIVTCGNTFDYPLIHCASMCRAGYGFSSCSRSMIGSVSLKDYPVIDIIGGKQKKDGRYDVVLSPEVMDVINETVARHGTIILSGAYLLSDSSSSIEFAENLLKVKYLTSESSSGVESPGFHVNLPVHPNDSIYTLEKCDALSPVDGSKTKILLNYSDSGNAACLCRSGKDYKLIFAGFPLEMVGSEYLLTILHEVL